MNFDGPRTQIIAEGKATDASVVVYTVPVGKKFWLIESMLVTDAGATGTAEVEWQDELGVHVRHFNFMDVRENNKGVIPADHFEPDWPIEMGPCCTIVVISDSASLEAQCDLFGFEVDE